MKKNTYKIQIQKQFKILEFNTFEEALEYAFHLKIQNIPYLFYGYENGIKEIYN